MPAIPRRIADKIRRGQYVDFTSLPPASGMSRQPPAQLDGGLVVIKAEDLIRAKRLIPDVGVWLQCYLMWMAVAVKEEPSRTQELLSYAFLIVKCSKSFRWPAWVLYDQEFRQSRAGDQSRRWDEIDSCLYTQMFSGKAEEGESWCSLCHTTEHTALSSPASNGPRESTDQLARTRWPGPSQGRRRYATNLTGLMATAEGAQTARTSMPVVGAVDPIPYLGARRELEWEARRMHRREQSRLNVGGNHLMYIAVSRKIFMLYYQIPRIGGG